MPGNTLPDARRQESNLAARKDPLEAFISSGTMAPALMDARPAACLSPSSDSIPKMNFPERESAWQPSRESCSAMVARCGENPRSDVEQRSISLCVRRVLRPVNAGRRRKEDGPNQRDDQRDCHLKPPKATAPYPSASLSVTRQHPATQQHHSQLHPIASPRKETPCPNRWCLRSPRKRYLNRHAFLQRTKSGPERRPFCLPG